jgi:hypothetical protein
VKQRRRSNGASNTGTNSPPNEVALDLLFSNLRDTKYLNAFRNPELFPINKKLGKQPSSDKALISSHLMRDVLIDPKVDDLMMTEFHNKIKVRNRELMIPYYKLKEYEESLEKAYDKKELNRRMRSISPDNFFKYKDFYGSKPEMISDSPTKTNPTLKEMLAQKSAGFESELTRKIKSKNLDSPFEWKMNAKTPERPFRDRFKYGNNKISGKITGRCYYSISSLIFDLVPNEENAFLAMQNYIEKEKKSNMLKTMTNL